MKRWSEVTRDDLQGEGQAVWDRIMASRGAVAGPYQPLMQVPVLADRVAHLGTYLRFEGLIPGPERELAVLVVAREVGCRAEWAGHEAIARKEGTRPEAIEIARTRGSSEVLPERERLILDLMRALHREEHRISDDLFAEAQRAFGQSQLTELIGLAGYYGMICLTLNAFGIEPSGAERPF